MPTCTQPYMDLVRTTSGLTPAVPWRGLSLFGTVENNNTPNPFEYDEWRELAAKLAREAFTHLEALGRAEAPASTKWNELRPATIELWNGANALPDALELAASPSYQVVLTSYKDVTEAAKTLAIDSACQMELIDNAIMLLGKKPPYVSTYPRGESTTGILGSIIVLASVGIIAGGMVWAIKRSRKDDSPAPMGAT